MRLTPQWSLYNRRLEAAAAPPQAYAITPPPTGFQWDFVTQNELTVTQNGVPVVDLVRI